MTDSKTISARPAGQTPTASIADRADPCTMVILGALGDLSKRKLLPAIYQLFKEGLVDDGFTILGVGRSDGDTDESFRTTMRAALGESDEVKQVDDVVWERICQRLFFLSADLTNAADYSR